MGELPPPETVPSELAPLLFAPTEPAERTTGAWVVYGWDWNAYPIALWPDELSARRDADRRGYGDVAFWPWGDFENKRTTEHTDGRPT